VVKRGKRTSGGVSEGLPGIYFAEILGFATLRPTTAAPHEYFDHTGNGLADSALADPGPAQALIPGLMLRRHLFALARSLIELAGRKKRIREFEPNFGGERVVLRRGLQFADRLDDPAEWKK